MRWSATFWLLCSFTLGVFAARLTNAPIIFKFYGAQLANPTAPVQPVPSKPRLPITSL